MSKKFEICSATYNIALNQDEDDVFRTGCAHLYHFLHGNGNNGRSGGYKPMMLKMHLELNELIEEAEGGIVEDSNSNNAERPLIQQLEAKFQSLEDSLQANIVGAVNKVTERIEKKLEKNLSNNIVTKATDVGNNTINHDSNNVLLNSSDNFPRQSDQQLEEKLKTLEDALQAKDDIVNEIMDRLEKKLEKNLSNIIDNKLADVGKNTIAQETNSALLRISDNAPRLSAQQLEAKLKTSEDSPQANIVDAVSKLIERMDRMFEKNLSNNIVKRTPDVGNNTIDHESKNALLGSSVNAPRQSVQQFEKEIKDLKDRIEQLELNKAVNEIAYIGNPTTLDNSTEKQQQQVTKHNSSQKPTNNGNNGSDDHSDGKKYQTPPKEKQEIEFDRDNLVAICPVTSSDTSLETAIHNVIQYAKEMKLSLTRDQIKHIDVHTYNQHYFIYFVFFRTRAIKEAFLMKSDILRRSPHSLQIVNESEYNTVYIRNFKSSDLKEDSAIVNVIGLAKQMGLTLKRDQINFVDVFTANQTCYVCRVGFFNTQVTDEFLKKSHILKNLPATKSLEIY